MGEKRFQGTFGRRIFSILLVIILSVVCVYPVSGEVVGTGDPNSFEPAAFDSAGDFNPSIADIAVSRKLPYGSIDGRDGRIDISDLAMMSRWWLDSCNNPSWCNGADIDRNGVVEINDLLRFTDYWLTTDDAAPEPNTAQWGQRYEVIQGSVVIADGRPYPVHGSTDKIIMTAAPATDNWGWAIAYQFECVKINNLPASVKSPWLYYPAGMDPTWFAMGLQEGTTYTYVCRVAEIRVPKTLADAGIVVNPGGSTVINANYVKSSQPVNSNWTSDSVPASAKVGFEWDAPTPIAWEAQPYQTGANSVSMTAVTASDAHPPVSYIFMRYLNADDPIPDKTVGPQQTRTWIDTDVQVGQTWTYSFVAVDNLGNTSDSAPRVTVPIVQFDTNPPIPNPMTWQIPPVRCNIHGQWYDFMQATVAVDPEGTVVQYQIRETNTGNTTAWQVQTDVIPNPEFFGSPFTGLSFVIPSVGEFTLRQYQVRARDSSPNQNTTAWSTPPLFPQ